MKVTVNNRCCIYPLNIRATTKWQLKFKKYQNKQEFLDLYVAEVYDCIIAGGRRLIVM
jgi:hypothetical protein